MLTFTSWRRCGASCSRGFVEGSWRPGPNTKLKSGDDIETVNLGDRSIFAVAAKRNWWFWRPVVNGVLTYSEADEMSMTDLLEANAALDIKIQKENEAMRKKSRG